MTTTEKRNGSRLTPEDHSRITIAARTYLTQCARPIRPEQIDTARRLATHAIGCTADDLREAERDYIAAHVLTIRNLIEGV